MLGKILIFCLSWFIKGPVVWRDVLGNLHTIFLFFTFDAPKDLSDAIAIRKRPMVQDFERD